MSEACRRQQTPTWRVTESPLREASARLSALAVPQEGGDLDRRHSGAVLGSEQPSLCETSSRHLGWLGSSSQTAPPCVG